MEAPKPAMTTSMQPQAVQMSAMNPPARQSNQTQERQHKRGPAARLRGGGAGRDCFLGMIECFLCFVLQGERGPGPENVHRTNPGFKDCCECFADIVCCPCEMCC
ncbi:hypothetical protein C8Q77DRAFT_910207 [Trametes polyzona]|nr:hypothetical protein C8Q77DRAFT_910207 [Trametes polyzona]